MCFCIVLCKLGFSNSSDTVKHQNIIFSKHIVYLCNFCITSAEEVVSNRQESFQIRLRLLVFCYNRLYDVKNIIT